VQFFCLVINGGVSAYIGSVIPARGAHSRIVGSWLAFPLLLIELVPELVRLRGWSIPGSGGGVFSLR
jgi:hypothetical protein